MKQSSFFVVILMALFGLMLTSLFVGNIPWQSLWVQTDIFWFALAHLRLPRTLLAVLAGAGLGVTGAALQGFLRNPLADPGLIGVSSGASLSAVLALSLGFSLATIPFLGIMGAIVTTLFLHQAVSKNKDTLRLILVGLALNSFLSALTALVLNFSKNPYKSLEIMFWLLGSFSDQPLDKVLWAVLPVVIGFWIIYRDRHVLDTLSFGEDFSHNMGHAITTVQKKLIIGIALIVGPIVSLGGIVGFVGLITPISFDKS
ncbi:MAG: iron ABC transporter permease [Holosporaceae bacterium]|nr:MAG: iron ABC transporter permease [Holosporaceae bacterium]